MTGALNQEIYDYLDKYYYIKLCYNAMMNEAKKEYDSRFAFVDRLFNSKTAALGIPDLGMIRYYPYSGDTIIYNNAEYKYVYFPGFGSDYFITSSNTHVGSNATFYTSQTQYYLMGHSTHELACHQLNSYITIPLIKSQ